MLPLFPLRQFSAGIKVFFGLLVFLPVYSWAGTSTTYTNSSTIQARAGSPANVPLNGITDTNGGTLTLWAFDVDNPGSAIGTEEVQVKISYDGGTTFSQPLEWDYYQISTQSYTFGNYTDKAILATYGSKKYNASATQSDPDSVLCAGSKSCLIGENSNYFTKAVFTIPDFSAYGSPVNLVLRLEMVNNDYIVAVADHLTLQVVTNNPPTSGNISFSGNPLYKTFGLSDFPFNDADTATDGDQLEYIKITSNPSAGDLQYYNASTSSWVDVANTQQISRADLNSNHLRARATFTFQVNDGYSLSLSGYTAALDNTSPTMTIAAAEVSDGDASDDATLSLTFTSSKATSDFTVGDINVTNGTISNFLAVSSTVYTATFAPAAIGETTIDVAGGAFTDIAGNNNNAATQFNWTYSADPTLKADVIASLLSKELIAYQFYKGSIQSVNDRLAWLASRKGNPKKSKQGVTFKFNDPILNQLLNSSSKRLSDYSEADVASFASKLGNNSEIYEDVLKAQALSLGISELKASTGDVDVNPAFESKSSGFSVWSDGEISIGKNSASSISSSREFNRKVFTIGLDKEYKRDNLIGLALSTGRENADVGADGSTVQSDNIGAIVYSTFKSEKMPQVELSLGYGDLTFETKRIDSGETLNGERKGRIYYGSVGFRRINTAEEEKVSYSAHGRVNLGQITLKSYSERGGVSAITYFDQDIDYEELETGVEMSGVMKWQNFTIHPHARLQYSYFLNKSSPASMRYTGLSTIHTSVVQTEMESGWSISTGVDLWDEGSLSSNLTLSRSFSNSDNYTNSINFGLRYRF